MIKLKKKKSHAPKACRVNMQLQNETLGNSNIQKGDEEEKLEKEIEKKCSESKRTNGRIL